MAQRIQRIKYIDFIERNIHGAWVVWGMLGIRQYYYYTKAQARQMYIDECKITLVFNQ